MADRCQQYVDNVNSIQQQIDLANQSLQAAVDAGERTDVIKDLIKQLYGELHAAGKELSYCRSHPPAGPLGPTGGLIALQGLKGNTLVAGKSTALRVYAPNSVISNIVTISVTVKRPDGSTQTLTYSTDSITRISTGSMGPSAVVIVPGRAVPSVGTYTISLKATDAVSGAQSINDRINADFLPTKDLRFLVSRIWSGTPTRQVRWRRPSQL